MKTLPADVSRLIYLYLDDVELAEACMVDKSFSDKVCNSTFWINRIIERFPVLNITVINIYKKGNTYWAYYYNLVKAIQDEPLYDVLIDSAKAGMNDLILIALNRGADIHAQYDLALGGASQNGHTDTVRLLLNKDANIHAQDDYALRLASLYGHADTVSLLLDNDADIHARDDGALIWASQNGHADTVRILLDRGADIHARGDEVLLWASRNGHTDTVKLLLDRGIDFHPQYTALAYARQFEQNEVVKLLKLSLDIIH